MDTENSVRSENTGVPIIREIMVATTMNYYSTKTLRAMLLNLIARRKIARETQATLTAIKATIEGGRRTA